MFQSPAEILDFYIVNISLLYDYFINIQRREKRSLKQLKKKQSEKDSQNQEREINALEA